MGKIWQQILPDIVPISTLVSVDWEEPQTLVKTAGVRAEIWTWDAPPNTKSECYALDDDICCGEVWCFSFQTYFNYIWIPYNICL